MKFITKKFNPAMLASALIVATITLSTVLSGCGKKENKDAVNPITGQPQKKLKSSNDSSSASPSSSTSLGSNQIPSPAKVQPPTGKPQEVDSVETVMKAVRRGEPDALLSSPSSGRLLVGFTTIFSD